MPDAILKTNTNHTLKQLEGAKRAVVATQKIASARAWNDKHFNSRMPTEMLCACFSFLPISDLLAASRVSAHWRTVALRAPTLWTDLPIYYHWAPRVINTLVARARDLPLHVRMAPDPPALPDFGNLLRRMASLNIMDVRPYSSDLEEEIKGLSELLSHEAPLMRLLHVATSTTRIPPGLFACQPGLVTLELSTFSLPESCPALASLRHFAGTIARSNKRSSGIQRIFDLCPLLQSLSLQVEPKCFSFPSTRVLLPHRPATSLKHLQLHLGGHRDLRMLLQSYAVLPSISVNYAQTTAPNTAFLLERFDAFDRVEVVQLAPIGPFALRIVRGGDVLQLTEMNNRDRCVRMYIRLCSDYRFSALTVLSVWHSVFVDLLLASPPLPDLCCIEVLAPAFSHDDGIRPPWNPNLAAAWYVGENVDAKSARLRYPAWSTFVFRTVAARPGKKVFVHLAALCKVLKTWIGPAAGPLQRTFRLEGIDIAEPIVASEVVELARLFDDIQLSNVKFGVEVREVEAGLQAAETGGAGPETRTTALLPAP